MNWQKYLFVYCIVFNCLFVYLYSKNYSLKKSKNDFFWLSLIRISSYLSSIISYLIIIIYHLFWSPISFNSKEKYLFFSTSLRNREDCQQKKFRQIFKENFFFTLILVILIPQFNKKMTKFFQNIFLSNEMSTNWMRSFDKKLVESFSTIIPKNL